MLQRLAIPDNILCGKQNRVQNTKVCNMLSVNEVQRIIGYYCYQLFVKHISAQ